MDKPSSVEAWSDQRRCEYLRSVRQRVNGMKLLHDAALKGTLADPYAINDEVMRAIRELEAVIGSLGE